MFKTVAVILMIMMCAGNAAAVDDIKLTEAVEQFGYFDKQIHAIMTDMALWLGWGYEDKNSGQKVAAQALQDLSALKKEVSAFKAPAEAVPIKDVELKKIERLENMYRDIYKKDEERIGEEFKEFYEFNKASLGELGAIAKKYFRDPKLTKDFDSDSEELILAGSAKDRRAYQKALDRIKEKNYSGAAKILKGMLARYDGTPFGDCIKVRLSDCYLKESEGSVRDAKKGMQLLNDVVNSGRYSPMMYDAFLRWRTSVQAARYGMANESGIPNQEYNRKRWEQVFVIRGHLAGNPGDKWAANQINLLISLPNIERGGQSGNYNLNYYGMLYMDKK